VLVCRDRDDALAALRSREPARVRDGLDPHRMTPVVHLFPGQGSQFPGMAAEAYRHEPVFRAEVDRCAEILRPILGFDLREAIHPADAESEAAAERLRRTAVAQPALFVVEYALAKHWQHVGFGAEAMIGHSIGEYVAACLAGVFSLEDALRLVAARGALMQALPPGAMLLVTVPEAEVRAALPDALDVAAVNGPALTVVSGPVEAVDAFQAGLEERGVHVQRLHTSHAFHSRMMDPAVALFEEVVRTVELRRAEIPFVSNLTGDWITGEQARDPGYWAAHLRAPVRFHEGLELLMREPQRILLEVGPGRTLATLARRHPARDAEMLVLHSLPGARDDATDAEALWNVAAEMWLVGMEAKWPRFYTGERRYRVPLPTYPFERGRFWLGVRDEETLARHAATVHHEWPVPQFFAPRNEAEETVAGIFRELFGVEQVSIYNNFFHMGGDSLLALQLASRMRERFGLDITLKSIWELRTVAEYALHASQLRQRESEDAAADADDEAPALALAHAGGG
jgi:acyl transferase domain-containing protein